MPTFRIRITLRETLVSSHVARIEADTPEDAAEQLTYALDRVDAEGWIDLRTGAPYPADAIPSGEEEHVMTRLEASEVEDSHLEYVLLDDEGRDVREIFAEPPAPDPVAP